MGGGGRGGCLCLRVLDTLEEIVSVIIIFAKCRMSSFNVFFYRHGEITSIMTIFAGVKLHSTVCLHVTLEVIFPVATVRANRTFEVFLSCVNLNVTLESGFATERFVADCAHVLEVCK